jgi:hypothetical protein
MRVFILSCVMAGVIAAGSAYVLSLAQQTVNQAYTTTSARVDPNY